ncbi:MAG TPA: tetratricopeptide repeat protein [Patescibacteria group bacterium]|nr:tetratricopeptide repeat protein [Patescibacteria group bacterium]
MSIKAIILIILGSAVLILAILLWFQRTRRRGSRRSAYIDALYALIDGRRDDALQLLTNAVRNGESDVDAYLQLGNLLREKNKPEKALQLHRGLSVRRDLGYEDEKRIQLAIADDLASLNKIDKSIATLEAVHRRKKDREVILKLHTLYHRAGDYERAHDMLKELSRFDAGITAAERAAYLATVSYTLYRSGATEEAKKYLGKAEREHRQSPPALYVAGTLAMEEQDMKTAARMWELLLQTDVAYFADAIPLLEKALYQSGRFQELEHLLVDLIERNPGRPSLVGSLASFYEKKGEIERAIEILEAERESFDLGSIESARLAALYIHAGRVEEARSVLEAFDTNMKQPAIYYCSACGNHADMPLGYCSDCARFNTFEKGYEKIKD